MLRSRLLPWLFSAGLFLAAACSDSVAPPASGTAAPVPQPSPTLVTLTGSIRLTGEKLYPVILSTSDGQDVRLTGESANMLVSVENAGVDIRGQWESDGAIGFFVTDFLVRTMAGNAVIDATLVAVITHDTGDDPIRYALRPTDGASDIMLADPSEDLLSHLNQRLWVAGVDGAGGAPTAYGVIKAANRE